MVGDNFSLSFQAWRLWRICRVSPIWIPPPRSMRFLSSTYALAGKDLEGVFRRRGRKPQPQPMALFTPTAIFFNHLRADRRAWCSPIRGHLGDWHRRKQPAQLCLGKFSAFWGRPLLSFVQQDRSAAAQSQCLRRAPLFTPNFPDCR